MIRDKSGSRCMLLLLMIAAESWLSLYGPMISKEVLARLREVTRDVNYGMKSPEVITCYACYMFCMLQRKNTPLQ